MIAPGSSPCGSRPPTPRPAPEGLGGGTEGPRAVCGRRRDRSPISSSARRRGRVPWRRTPGRSASATVWRSPYWRCGLNCDRSGAAADRRSSRHTSARGWRRFAAGRRSAFFLGSRAMPSGQRRERHRSLAPNAGHPSPGVRTPESKRSRFPGWPRHPKLAERRMAERVGFEPTVPFRARLISSQVR